MSLCNHLISLRGAIWIENLTLNLTFSLSTVHFTFNGELPSICDFYSSTSWSLCSKILNSTAAPATTMEFSRPKSSSWIHEFANVDCIFRKCYSKIRCACGSGWFSEWHHRLWYPNNGMDWFYCRLQPEIERRQHSALDF